MVKFILLLLLQADGDAAILNLGGSHSYETLKDCKADGVTMANWLTQPGMRVEWQCRRIEAKFRSPEALG